MDTTGDRRIPSLDGLRGISITLVFLAHLAGTRNFPIGEDAAHFWAAGEFGVRVFFVLSGFLITGLLLDEIAKTGRIHLGRFYLRRTLRIFPPYYVFIAALAVAGAAGLIQLAPHDVAHTVTYTSNYYADRSWFVGHTWSLSVEEQFYLLWPATLLLVGTRRGMILAALVVLVVPFVRLAEWELLRAYGEGIGHRFETVADAMAMGCLMAAVRPWLHAWRPYERFLQSGFFWPAVLLLLTGNLTGDHPLAHFGPGMSMVNLGVVLAMDWCVTFHDGRVGRVLNWRPLVYVGWMSYSLYLWQQPFLNRASTALVASFPLNLVLATALAFASFHLVERPSLRFRRWLEQRRPRPIAAAAASGIEDGVPDHDRERPAAPLHGPETPALSRQMSSSVSPGGS
ncbi:MAG: acyltransferase family protein [Vicinamibacterales bacterium]